jgi:hypothetical protein
MSIGMADIKQCVLTLNNSFSSGKTLPTAWRKEQLRKLWHLICVWDSLEYFNG